MTDAGEPSVGWREMACAVPGGVAVQEAERLTYVSPVFAEFVGTDPETLTDRSWRQLFDGTETDRMAEAVDAARTDGRWLGETVVDCGSERTPVAVTLSAPPDGDGVVVWSLTDAAGGATRQDENAAGTQRAERTDQTDRNEQTKEFDEPRMAGRETLLPGASPELTRAVLDAVDDVVYIIAEDGQSWFWNDQLAETTGYSHEEIAAMHPKEFIPEDQHEYVPGLRDEIEEIEDRQVEVDIRTSDGERITHEFSGTTFEDSETGDAYRCGIARDITERLERERTLARQRDELATLNRINGLLFETARELIRTGSRNAVEQTVCDRLASSELYNFAWIGERELHGERIVRRTAAGLETDLDCVPGSDDDADDGPVARAMDSGDVHVASDSEPAVDRWRTATESDITSVIAVPLGHGETVYGVLVVATSRESVVDARERAGFEVLGQLIGVVIHAARSRDLLFADAVVELEFDFSGSDSPFVDVTEALDCRLTLDGYVPASDGWVMYLSVDGTDPAAAVERFAASDRVDRARHITGGDGTSRLELVVTELSVLHVITEAGATVQRASTSLGRARFVVEAALDADHRQIVADITDSFPAAELTATRKRDREITTVGRPGGVLDELTDRQREVLEAAYQAGYFAWPRESTAEEVADALGLTSATLHGHLRKAEVVILSALLDDQ